jgi:hypothetical protein
MTQGVLLDFQAFDEDWSKLVKLATFCKRAVELTRYMPGSLALVVVPC